MYIDHDEPHTAYRYGYVCCANVDKQYGPVLFTGGKERLFPCVNHALDEALIAQALDRLSIEGWRIVAVSWEPTHTVMVRIPCGDYNRIYGNNSKPKMLEIPQDGGDRWIV